MKNKQGQLSRGHGITQVGLVELVIVEHYRNIRSNYRAVGYGTITSESENAFCCTAHGLARLHMAASGQAIGDSGLTVAIDGRPGQARHVTETINKYRVSNAHVFTPETLIVLGWFHCLQSVRREVPLKLVGPPIDRDERRIFTAEWTGRIMSYLWTIRQTFSNITRLELTNYFYGRIVALGQLPLAWYLKAKLDAGTQDDDAHVGKGKARQQVLDASEIPEAARAFPLFSTSALRVPPARGSGEAPVESAQKRFKKVWRRSRQKISSEAPRKKDIRRSLTEDLPRIMAELRHMKRVHVACGVVQPDLHLAATAASWPAVKQKTLPLVLCDQQGAVWKPSRMREAILGSLIGTTTLPAPVATRSSIQFLRGGDPVSTPLFYILMPQKISEFLCDEKGAAIGGNANSFIGGGCDGSGGDDLGIDGAASSGGHRKQMGSKNRKTKSVARSMKKKLSAAVGSQSGVNDSLKRTRGGGKSIGNNNSSKKSSVIKTAVMKAGPSTQDPIRKIPPMKTAAPKSVMKKVVSKKKSAAAPLGKEDSTGENDDNLLDGAGSSSAKASCASGANIPDHLDVDDIEGAGEFYADPDELEAPTLGDIEANAAKMMTFLLGSQEEVREQIEDYKLQKQIAVIGIWKEMFAYYNMTGVGPIVPVESDSGTVHRLPMYCFFCARHGLHGSCKHTSFLHGYLAPSMYEAIPTAKKKGAPTIKERMARLVLQERDSDPTQKSILEKHKQKAMEEHNQKSGSSKK